MEEFSIGSGDVGKINMKGGIRKMADYPKELEIDRVMNVVKTFGWEKVKEEIIGQDVVITIKKELMKEEEVSETSIPS